jgi:hypothetical protein
MIADDLSEYLAKLEELRARREISEETYAKLKDEYWRKLEQIVKSRTQDREAREKRRLFLYVLGVAVLALFGFVGYQAVKPQTPLIVSRTMMQTLNQTMTQTLTVTQNPASQTSTSEVLEEKDMVFTIDNLDDSFHAEITEIAHTHGYFWDRVGWFKIKGKIANLQAFDLDGMKKVKTYLSEEGGWTYFGAYLDPPRSGDFKVLLIFDRIHQGDISVSSEGRRIFFWSWGTDEHPMPQSVKVKLPPGASLVSVGATNYHTESEGGRVIVSFEGVAPPNGSFQWYVEYS